MAGFVANDIGAVDISCFIPASADLSALQYHFVRIDASELDNEIELVATAGGQALGILQERPKASTAQWVRVRVKGCSKLVYGGTIARGASIQSDSDGEGLTASTADYVLAYALESGADQDLRHVVVNCPGGQNNA